MDSLIEKIIADKALLGLVVALIGLLGVVLGSLLNATTQWLFQRSKTKKEAEYLAIRVAFMLDRFVRLCVPVAHDDGRAGGHDSGDEYAVASTTCPAFDPEKEQFDWKALPTSLTYEILNFTNLVSNAENRVSDFFDDAPPPEYSECFVERQFQYAKLGLQAAELATKLRRRMALPRLEVAEWDPLEHLVRIRTEIETNRLERDNRHAEMMKSTRSQGASPALHLPVQPQQIRQ